MRQEVLITTQQDRQISVLLQNGKIVEFLINIPGEENLCGNIYIGKVKNIVKNISGAFVEISDGILCFYPLDIQRQKTLKQEDEILIQVKREGSKLKHPMASEQLELTGENLVLTSGRDFVGISGKIKDAKKKKQLKSWIHSFVTEEYGFIVRTQAENKTQEEIAREAQALAQRYGDLCKKAETRKAFQIVDTNQSFYGKYLFGLTGDALDGVITDDSHMKEQLEKEKIPTVFLPREGGALDRRYRVKHYLHEALSKKVWLKSGGFLVIERTEALWVIDVNTGKSIGKNNPTSHYKKVNIEAAGEAARQIRLRNLSGIILIDFIDMDEETDQRELLHMMKRYLREDSIRASALDMTKLGLMEITRMKIRKPLIDFF